MTQEEACPKCKLNPGTKIGSIVGVCDSCFNEGIERLVASIRNGTYKPFHPELFKDEVEE